MITPEQQKKIDELKQRMNYVPPINITAPKTVFDKVADYERRNNIIPAVPVVPKTTSAERTGNIIQSAGERVQSAISGEGEFAGQSAIRRGATAAAEAFTAIPKVGIEALPDAPREEIKKLGEQIGETLGPVFKKLTDFLSPEVVVKWVQDHPDAAKALEETAGTVAEVGKIADVIGAGGVLKTAGSAVVKGGKDMAINVAETTRSGITDTQKRVAETIKSTKEKVIGKEKTPEEQEYVDTLDIVREPISTKYIEQATKEKRVYYEGIVNERKFRESKKETRMTEAILPLVKQGRIKKGQLPSEQVPEIDLEISRIDNNVKQLLYDKKIPFNEKQLRAKLNDAKKDNEIVFSSDATLEKTYDALIEAFVAEVAKKDTLGLFEARQSFDKIPQVKKYLDGEKPGENLRAQSVLAIRRAANEYTADLLDARIRSEIIKTLQPSEAKPIFTLAKKYDNLSDFTKDILGAYAKSKNDTQKFTVQNDALKQSWGKSGRAVQPKLSKKDIEELWDIAQQEINPGAGEALRNALRTESYLFDVIENLAKKEGKLKGTNIERVIEKHPILKSMIKNTVPFTTGAVIF